MLRWFTILFCILLATEAAYPWGPTGHRVIGQVAEQYLTKKARKRLNKILNGQSLAIVSTWMDEVRSDSTFDYMTDWHWVTIPDGMTYEETQKNRNGDIIETLERIAGGLRAGQTTPEKQKQYLLILVHLVGDIHMPLHVGNGEDRGGNDIRVSWFGRPSNLHRVWDSDMIDETRLSYTELAASLEQPGEEQVKSWQQSGIRDWAHENTVYRQPVYQIGNGQLGYDYSYWNLPMVRQRLLQAGIRLAGLLNEIFGQR